MHGVIGQPARSHAAAQRDSCEDVTVTGQPPRMEARSVMAKQMKLRFVLLSHVQVSILF